MDFATFNLLLEFIQAIAAIVFPVAVHKLIKTELHNLKCEMRCLAAAVHELRKEVRIASMCTEPIDRTHTNRNE